jgi:hypothetical protein
MMALVRLVALEEEGPVEEVQALVEQEHLFKAMQEEVVMRLTSKLEVEVVEQE